MNPESIQIMLQKNSYHNNCGCRMKVVCLLNSRLKFDENLYF